MDFRISADVHKDSKVDEVLYELELDEHFSNRYYDDSGITIFIVLMCRAPYLNFKQRIRLSKTENCLYMDIMLDFEQMKDATPGERKSIVAEKLITEVPQIIAKYKFRDFDLGRFSADLKEWFENHGWIDL